MKKSFTTLLIAAICVMGAFAQQPTAVIKKASVAPEVDGVIDDVWAEADKNNIDKPYREEVPTIGLSGETTWRGTPRPSP